MIIHRSSVAIALVVVMLMLGAPTGAQDDGPYPDAVLVASVAELDFGDVGVGKERTRSVKLTNVGGTVAKYVSIDVVGSSRFDYDSSSHRKPGAILAPTGSETWPLIFSPTSIGSANATIVITYDVNDFPGLDDTATVEVDLRGDGVVTEPWLVAEPSSKDLGRYEGRAGLHQTVQVTNVSSAPVTIDDVTATVTNVRYRGMSGNCRFATIAPGEECSVRVDAQTYESGGSFTIVLRFYSEDPQSPLVVSLRGRGRRSGTSDYVAPVMREAPRTRALLRAFRAKARYQWLWSADDNVAVARFQAQLRVVGGGPWKTVVGRSAPVDADGSQRVAMTVPRGKTFRVRTRAFDPAGNASGWSHAKRTVTYRNIDKRSALTGSWKSVPAKGAAIGNDVLVTRKRGSTVSITTSARSIALVGRVGPKGGWVTTGPDEAFEMIPLKAPKRKDLVVLKSWTWPTVAVRTVTVTALVQEPFRPQVALDAWVIER